MIKVIILGIGNLGYHLATEMSKNSSIELVQLYNRNKKALEPFKNKIAVTTHLSKLKEADIYIICSSDTAIEKISESLNISDAVVVHTSGSSPVNILNKHHNFGVFYPLQSFTKQRDVNFNSLPICIEANSSTTLETLSQLAESITNNVQHINSEQRKELHKAAVFVNNFVNHLYYIGENICESNNIDPQILQPLIQETTNKIKQISAFDAQTGPARRGDSKTIENHLKNLSSINKEIYKLLSESIAQVYGKKL